VTCYPAWFPPPSDGQFVSTPTPGCKLPPSYWITCGGETNHRHEAAIQSSIDYVIANYPQYFDMVHLNPSTNQPLVVDIAGLVKKMQEYLQGKGYCTKWDGEEMQIKSTNEFSEHYDFLLSSGHIRRESYASICYPAAF
jgi:hypothetical protein